MIHNSLNFFFKPKPILIFIMLLLSTQGISGQLTMVNGNQNKGTVFTYSPHAREYNCVMHRNQYLGKKYSVGPGGSFVVNINRDTSGDCSGEPALFSIYTENQRKIAFKMHGNGGFVYVPISASSGGYQCENSNCLNYNSFQGKYAFTTNFVAPTLNEKQQLKLGKMKGKWEIFCPPGRQKCNHTITRSVTKGSSTKDIRSKEVANAIAQSLTFGIESEVKIGGSGSKVNFESTTSFEHTTTVATANEISSSQKNSSTDSENVFVDYTEYDVAVVWRWVLSANEIGGIGDTVTIKTNNYTCTPDIVAPGYLPFSPQHVANPCLTKRKKATQQTQSQNQVIQFSVNPITQLSNGMPSNPGAACETEDQKYLFFQGQDYWIYDNNDGQSYGPVPSSSEGFPDYIDACVNGYNKKVYLFKGSQYWRYDIVSWSVDAGYPKEISDGWSGLPNYFSSAARIGNNKIKFFSGDSVYNWDMTTDTMIPGVGSMRSELSQLPNSTDASIYIHNKTLFFGSGNMYNPITN